MMQFSEKLIEDFDKISSIYDLAAYCYAYMISAVKNQIVFLGEYIDINGDEEKDNPNFQMLSLFSVNIKKIFEQNPVGLFWKKDNSNKLLNCIVSAENELIDFEDSVLNHATIPFFVLNGIELFIQDRPYESHKCAPLNGCCKDFCLIYINSIDSMIDKIIINRKYPEKIKKNEIRNYFAHIIFFETSELPDEYGVPKLVTLQKNEAKLEEIVGQQKIKIALIPTLREKWFEFTTKRGSVFEIDYDENLIGTVKNRVCSLLLWAIECEANVIVFPEYVCNEEIQNAIGEALAHLYESEPEKCKDLLFVVAGSAWTEDSNNVSCIYSYDGILLGKTYKYSAYNNYINGRKYVERLENPGKEITLIKIPRIGVFQIEICRNVSENEFCLKLANMFGTQFLLIPAWSSSVNIGFKKQIDAIISSSRRVCAAISNCCAAFPEDKKFRKQIGIASAPKKNQTYIEANTENVERKKARCDRTCGRGCFFEVCYDFGEKHRKDISIQCIFREKP